MIRPFDLKRRLAAEALGSALLASLVVGSGIMAQRLCGNDGMALLANALATGAGLLALILAFGPISGAHFNPAVSLGFLITGKLRLAHAGAYTAAQILGALLGVFMTHAMFGLRLVQASSHARNGGSQLLSEVIGTFTLVLIILLGDRLDPRRVPYAVAGLVTGGYWFTVSTFFTNPALVLARSLTDTFSGIRPTDAPGFIAIELVGAILAAIAANWFLRHAQEHP
ncbi:MAG TPA: MIP/aquaporin family protein [Holophagaceae bacterium]|jgi:glycerol uptake facilitator-like aquaporin|nr:MIP/aquaporin family protein [Holophagaceae bacterium]